MCRRDICGHVRRNALEWNGANRPARLEPIQRASACQKLTYTFVSITLHTLQRVYRDWNERVREFLRAGRGGQCLV
jgi:hypothetical protein